MLNSVKKNQVLKIQQMIAKITNSAPKKQSAAPQTELQPQNLKKIKLKNNIIHRQNNEDMIKLVSDKFRNCLAQTFGFLSQNYCTQKADKLVLACYVLS